MAVFNDTEIGGDRRFFPSTHWSLLAAVKDEITESHRAALNILIEKYWKPVYYYLRKRGYNNEDAKDLTQDFFTTWLQKDLFGKADASRGRFRTYLLTSLNNFLSNVYRAKNAQKRRPPGGFVSVHRLSADFNEPEPIEKDTPENIFHRTWVAELLFRALNSLQCECRSTGKQIHYKIFQKCIIDPVLKGSKATPRKKLAEEFGLTEKQVSNHLITARRAYQRLLKDEIRIYAASEEDVDQEIRELFKILDKEKA